jgi:hypothetical protein
MLQLFVALQGAKESDLKETSVSSVTSVAKN